MSQRDGHSTVTAIHAYHDHAEGGFMLEYRFMRMTMEGLMDGFDEVDGRTIPETTAVIPQPLAVYVPTF